MTYCVDRRGIGQAEMPHHPRGDGHRGAGDADVGTAHATVGEQLADDPFRRVDTRGKTDRLGLRDHRRIDADHPPPGIHQRAAGIARIERGVGLDDIVHQPARGGTQRAPERGDHAGGDGLRIAQRIADGNGHLTHSQLSGIAKLHVGQRGG